MRKVTIITFFALVLSFSSNTWGLDANGLVAYWNFDEGQGDILYDSAGTNHGTVNGAQRVTGIMGGALSFDGVNDYVTVPNAPALNITEDLTISAWVFFNKGGTGENRSEQGIVTKTVGSGRFNNPYDFRTSIDPQPDLAFVRADVAGHESGYSTENVPLHQWHHIAVTVEANTLTFYIDAMPTGITGGLTKPASANTRPVLIGKRDDGLYFGGLLDDVRIYNRALAAGEISELRQMGIPKLVDLDIIGPNEVAEESAAQYTTTAIYSDDRTEDVTDQVYWAVMPDNYADINDSGLLTTYELVMPTEDVTIYAEYAEGETIVQAEKDVQIFALCPQGTALDFDGTNDSVALPSNSPEWLPYGDFSVIQWVKFETNWDEPQPHNAVLFNGDGTWSGSASNRSGFKITRRGEQSGRLEFYLVIDNAHYILVGDTVLTKGHWYHVAAIREGTLMRLFVNGELDGELTCGSGPVDYVGTYSVDDVRIGARWFSETDSRYFVNGVIDEAAIYNRALSSQEAWMLMHSRPKISDPNLLGYWSFDEGSGQTAHDSSGNANDGYLGSDPCNPDTADPCWVEPGAPLNCTPRQMIVRNLDGAIERKRIAKQQIDEALERERASAILLTDEMKTQKHRCWRSCWNFMQPVVEIKKSMLFEEQCKHKLQASIEALERALQWLLNDAVPDWPKKPDKNKPPKCDK